MECSVVVVVVAVVVVVPVPQSHRDAQSSVHCSWGEEIRREWVVSVQERFQPRGGGQARMAAKDGKFGLFLRQKARKCIYLG